MKRNNLTRLYVGITIGVFACLVFYAGCSFVLWDPNPSNWETHHRGFLAVLSVVVLIMSTSFSQTP